MDLAGKAQDGHDRIYVRHTCYMTEDGADREILDRRRLERLRCE